MILYRLAPDGQYVFVESDGDARILYSDPFETRPGGFQLGRRVDLSEARFLAPVARPGKVLGIGRIYREHAAELGNPMPSEPLLFLKAPGTVIGPGTPVVLPPESERVEFEGEIAVVIRERLRRASPEAAVAGILGVTCACDVTARDLQRRDATFARGKSFDTFCPTGPGVLLNPDLDALEVRTRINGQERQHGRTSQMEWSIPELLAYASRMMTLEPGDLVLTGTPSGVGPLQAGDRIEVEVSGLPSLRNPVEAMAPDGEEDA